MTEPKSFSQVFFNSEKIENKAVGTNMADFIIFWLEQRRRYFANTGSFLSHTNRILFSETNLKLIFASSISIKDSE